MFPGQSRTLALLVGALVLAACGTPVGPTNGVAQATPTDTAVAPTSTPVPLAAKVNGEPILLSSLIAEVDRFEAAQRDLGTDLATLGDYRSQVLQALIDRRLLAQAAIVAGFALHQAAVETRLGQLTAERGGGDAMAAWLADNGYTLETFKVDLAEDMLAAYTVGQIASGVPERIEQVHARHILTAARQEAEALRAQVAGGADFASLAATYSLDLTTRVVGGDLGWFPRGYLTVPEVEATAFALQPGELSEVVESRLGFHIVTTLERGEHPLSPDAMDKLRTRAVEDWLASQRQVAQIEILRVP